MIYFCRRDGAIGIATEVVHADNVDALRLQRPDLEPLAGFKDPQEAQRYSTGLAMDVVTRREFERSILSRSHG